MSTYVIGLVSDKNDLYKKHKKVLLANYILKSKGSSFVDLYNEFNFAYFELVEVLEKLTNNSIIEYDNYKGYTISRQVDRDIKINKILE